MEPTLDSVRFDSLRNALYHKARQRALEAVDRVFNFLVIILGATAASKIIGPYDYNEFLTGFMTLLIGSTQLVFNPGGSAKTHEFLQRQFYDLLADMDECISPSKEKICSWNAKLTRLYGEQPPVLNALDAIAYNQASASLGASRGQRLIINWYQSLFRHIIPFNSTYFETIEEREDRNRIKRLEVEAKNASKAAIAANKTT